MKLPESGSACPEGCCRIVYDPKLSQPRRQSQVARPMFQVIMVPDEHTRDLASWPDPEFRDAL